MFDDDKSLSSEELIARVRLNERDAFDLLYSRHHRPSFDYAYRVLFQRRDAEDVVQEAFLRVFLAARRGKYDPTRGSFKTYLYRILRNLCYDRLALKKPLNATDLENEENTEAEPLTDRLRDGITPVHQAQGNALKEQVSRALKRLPTIQREALTLRGFEGLSYKEISRILGRPVSHVKIILFRARQALARLLEEPLPRGLLLPLRSGAPAGKTHRYGGVPS